VQQKRVVQELAEVLAPLRTFLSDPATQRHFARQIGESRSDRRDRAFLEYLHAKEQFASLYLVNLFYLMSLHAQKAVSRSHPVMKQLLELQYVARSLKKLDCKFEVDMRALMQICVSRQVGAKGKRSQASLGELFVNARAEINSALSQHGGEDSSQSDSDAEAQSYSGDGAEEQSASGGSGSDDVEGEGDPDESGSDGDYEAFIREEEDAMNSASANGRRKKQKYADSSDESAGDSSDDDIADAGEFSNARESEDSQQERSDRRKKQKQTLTQSLDAFGSVYSKDVSNRSRQAPDDSLSTAGPKLDKREKRHLQQEESDEEAQEGPCDADEYYEGEKMDQVEQLLGMLGEAKGDKKRARRAAPSDDADIDPAAEGLYESFANKKKSYLSKKKDHYTPEARYGGMFDLESSEIGFGKATPAEGKAKRAATYEMMKNKGLTPHRKKENRNPRVKKRIAYDKALVRRRGQVREVNTSGVNTGSAYAGETTGIKANLSRSRKIST